MKLTEAVNGIVGKAVAKSDLHEVEVRMIKDMLEDLKPWEIESGIKTNKSDGGHKFSRKFLRHLEIMETDYQKQKEYKRAKHMSMEGFENAHSPEFNMKSALFKYV